VTDVLEVGLGGRIVSFVTLSTTMKVDRWSPPVQSGISKFYHFWVYHNVTAR